MTSGSAPGWKRWRLKDQDLEVGMHQDYQRDYCFTAFNTDAATTHKDEETASCINGSGAAHFEKRKPGHSDAKVPAHINEEKKDHSDEKMPAHDLNRYLEKVRLLFKDMAFVIRLNEYPRDGEQEPIIRDAFIQINLFSAVPSCVIPSAI